jgi:hypothetical protein
MPMPLTIQNRLRALSITEAMPAWRILQNAWLLPPTPNQDTLFGDTVEQALKKLMKSFFEYGRQHWTWSQTSGPGAADGGLVKGVVSNCACASFNLNFKWLAEQCLGIQGITPNSYNRQFLTMPGRNCIDSKWAGNVRTATRAFEAVRCFKFSQHHWVSRGGVNYDVCYNDTFASTAEIIWTGLLPADPSVVKKSKLRPDQVYKLEKPLPEGDHLVMLQQYGPNGWPTWQIVDQSQVGK